MFLKLAPESIRDRVPRVETIDGVRTWVFDGEPAGEYGAGGVVARDGSKESAYKALKEWDFEQVHLGGSDPEIRLQVLDECGIDAQVIFPGSLGLGGQGLGVSKDENLCIQVLQMYNDRNLGVQASTNERLLPLPVMPAWSIDRCIQEAQRVAADGARGVNMTSDPQDLGAPDLASRAWDPFWEVLSDLQMPVHFHIGASITAMSIFEHYPWPSQALNVALGIQGTMLFIGNARVVINTIMSGMFDRHPNLKMVSVESGVGWIPFILEALDYEMTENAPEELAELGKMPSEYFRSNMYATFWFENNRNKLPALIDAVGEDCILFETDFPHPTCLYPAPLQTVEAKMQTLTPEVRNKIYGENARKLYRL